MGEERSIDIKTIFAEAAEKPTPAERAAYLDRVCGGDAKLRREVEILLAAHDRAGSFLELPLSEVKATLDRPPQIDSPGTVIGRYQLLELIGEGGMGLVYLADQKEPVRRRVAFKIIKPGMDSKQVIGRFEAERQALALLDHPNVAKVLDAGTTDTGRPYFVMEYVKGTSITRYCDDNKLTIEQRLRLFEEVCEAVQHAHTKGIIHRDLKPSNILVAVHGDRAVPKIIDFGIAKAVTQPLTDKTFVTFQGQLLGTPEYMSPEQVDFAAQDIDTRSDIYSLGVVLYELLAGVLPFESGFFERAGLAEIQQAIREQEPVAPSRRLTSLGEEAKTIAASRNTQVVPLARRLHRELEWIPLKAMRKDRCRRYRSASEMADDIRNYLNGLPLLAGPETTIYRMQKFARKHAGSVATISLVATAIILGLVISTVMYFRAEASRIQAEQERMNAVAAKQAERVQRTAAEQAAEEAKREKQFADEQRERAEQISYDNFIVRGAFELTSGNTYRASHLLESCPRRLRGWEWGYLWQRLRSAGRILPIPIRYGTFAISADGGRMATFEGGAGLWGDRLCVFDTGTGHQLATLSDWGRLSEVAFSPDGSRIASANEDATISIWNALTGEIIGTSTACGTEVLSITFRPDGKQILAVGRDDTVMVWDLGAQNEVRRLVQERGAAIRSAVYSLNGKRVLVIGGALAVWDTNGSQIRRLLEDVPPRVAVLNKDGTLVAYPGAPGVVIRDVMTGQKVQEHPAENPVTAICFDPNDRYLCWGGLDGTVTVLNIKSGTEELKTRGHRRQVKTVTFLADGCHIVSTDDRTAMSWNISGTRKTSNRTVTLKQFGVTAFSRDCRYVAGVHRNKIQVVDVIDPCKPRVLDVNVPVPQAVAVSAGGRYLAMGVRPPTIQKAQSSRRDTSKVRIWDVEIGRELCELEVDGVVKTLIFRSNNRQIISHTTTGVSLSDVQDVTHPNVLALYRYIGAVALSPNENDIVMAYGNTLRVCDIESARIRHTVEMPDYVTEMAFSLDGKRLAVRCSSGETAILNVNTWSAIAHFYLDGRLPKIALSPDGHRMWAGPTLWDTDTASELLSLQENDGLLTRIGFEGDGKIVLGRSVRKDGDSIIIWSTEGIDRTDDTHDWHARGMIHYYDGDYDLAISALTDAIDIEPKHMAAYQYRGLSHAEKGELDQALLDLEIALKLAGRQHSRLHIMENMADTYERKGCREDAARVLHEILEAGMAGLNAGDEIILRTMSKLATLSALEGQHEEATHIYSTMLETYVASRRDASAWKYATDLPEFYYEHGQYAHARDTLLLLARGTAPVRTAVVAMNQLAWICATCSADQVRNGREAVEYATKACELSGRKNPSYLNTLAAAYAEIGDFAAAVKIQQEAIELIGHGFGGVCDGLDYDARLKLYQEGKAYREEAVKPAHEGAGS
jgi:serine/threonine protein kinase/WD40 repeat protein/tetratricopeptide (TPR) repeat protein